MQLNFDASTVAPSTPLENMPIGWYAMVIEEGEQKATAAGTGSYLQLTLKVIDGEFANRKQWDRLNLSNPNPTAVKIAQETLSAICHATGQIRLQNAQQLYNIPMAVKVGMSKPQAGYESRNEIKGYAHISKLAELQAKQPKPAGSSQGWGAPAGSVQQPNTYQQQQAQPQQNQQWQGQPQQQQAPQNWQQPQQQQQNQQQQQQSWQQQQAPQNVPQEQQQQAQQQPQQQQQQGWQGQPQGEPQQQQQAAPQGQQQPDWANGSPQQGNQQQQQQQTQQQGPAPDMQMQQAETSQQGQAAAASGQAPWMMGQQ